MTEQGSEFTGELGQVLQDDPNAFPLRPIAVAIDGVAPVHLVGSRAGALFSRGITDDPNAVRLVPADQRRRVVRILTSGQTIYVGTDQASCNQSVGFLVPVGILIELTCVDEIWVRNPNAGTTAIVSVIAENWAD